ncbi:MAG: tetratricopeptide repeat protein [Steroidobacteraceae bacterium]
MAAPAAERYKPDSADTIVLRLGPPIDTAVPLEQQVARLVERARSERDPRLAGRAEALLALPLRSQDPSPSLLVAHADLLQQRHAFAAALHSLERALTREPGNVRARLMRAQLLLVQGAYDRARPDCMALIAAGETVVGLACRAQVGAALGDPRAGPLSDLALRRAGALAPRVAAWAYGVRAELAQRRGDALAAEVALRAALAAAPQEEYARIALADHLLARGAAREALPLLDLERPSAGLLLRRVMALRAIGQPATQPLAELRDLLALGARRGERVHLREEALLALDIEHDPARALALAQENFALQKELPDVRLLARAAVAARSVGAMQALRAWLAASGYRDTVVEGLLA